MGRFMPVKCATRVTLAPSFGVGDDCVAAKELVRGDAV